MTMETRKTAKSTRLALAAGGLALVLSGCSAVDRIQNIGKQPELAPIENPTQQANYRPVSLPMPAPQVSERQAGSLWRAGSRSFFKDLRANRVGDIVTVVINLDERGRLQNETRRGRTSEETNNIGNLFGFQGDFKKFLPDNIAGSLPNVLDLDSSVDNRGTGRVDRSERINLRLAALITQVLPNGNMVLHGRQEVRLNYEVRELQLAGVIRPEDISPQNTIDYDKIAEARVAYGGRGQIMDMQQPRYGSQFLDIILPF